MQIKCITHLFKSSPFTFLNMDFFCMFGDNCCESSMAAELGVGNADGTEVGVGIIGCVFGKAASLLTICG